jgi:hypothetical protein
VIWVELAAFAVFATGMVRFALIVRPPPPANLPHPSKVAGMPMAGPASPAAAHAAINRKAN